MVDTQLGGDPAVIAAAEAPTRAVVWGRRLAAPPTPRRVVVALVVAVVAGGTVLRFAAPPGLWLDETLSVNIAKLPIWQIPAALSHDGAPPLYYLVLHVWMLAFGRGDVAVRSLAGVTSAACLPLFWLAGRRIGGRRTAWVALLLAATSPFAIEYATATRMYSQMILLSLLGLLALERAVESPTRPRLVALGAVTAAALYTHYWALYLVAATAGWLVVRLIRERRRGAQGTAHRAALWAMVAGGACFLPWAPIFVYQTLHTGTPWASSAGPADVLGIFADYAGSGPWAALLSTAFVLLAFLGLFGRLGGDGGGPIHLVGHPLARIAPVAGIFLGTMGLAVVAGEVANAAFVARYAAVGLPLFLLVVATGAVLLPDRRLLAVLLAVVSVAGLLTDLGEATRSRTQAVAVAQVLNAEAQPGDLVVYCPDQLGPAVDRLLQVPAVTELTFPRAIGPARVDWVDYKQAIAGTDVGTFARTMLAKLGPDATLWVVERDGYAGFGNACSQLVSWFGILRPTGATLVHASPGGYYEAEDLLRFGT